MSNKPMTNKEFSDWIESTMKDCYQNTSHIKYSVKKAYTYDRRTGRENVIWYIMYGEAVVDAFTLRRDAKFWAERWNHQLAKLRLAEDTQQAASGV